MRLEINTVARGGDILDDEGQLVGRLSIGKGLSECTSVDEWHALLEGSIRAAGFVCDELPEASVPLTAENAVDRFAITLR